MPPASSQPGFQWSLHQVQSFFRLPSVFSLLSVDLSLLGKIPSLFCDFCDLCYCLLLLLLSYLSLSSFVPSFNSFSPISCYPDGGISRYQSWSTGLLSLYWALDLFFFSNKYNYYSSLQICVSRVNLSVQVSSN